MDSAEKSSTETADAENTEDRCSYIIQRGVTDNRKTVNAAEARRFVQSVLSKSLKLSTLIGSGASNPAVPLMGETFNKLRGDLKGEDPAVSKLLEERITKLAARDGIDPAEYSDIEELLSWVSLRIEGAFDNADDDRLVARVVKGAFLESIRSEDGKPRETVLDSYRKVIQGLGVSRQILARNGQSAFDIVDLFTTNYDLFHELALESSGYAYTDGFANGSRTSFSPREFHRRPIDLDERFRDHLEPINPFFRLYKLHGSTNWRNVNETIVRVPRLSGIDDQCSGDSQLIAPMTSKYALTQGSPYSDIFREFVNTLAAPSIVLMTCGFSFADSHIANLIKQALARPDFTLLAFIGNPAQMGTNSPTKTFHDEVEAPNTYFIYPSEDDPSPSRPLYFSEFAEFVRPEIVLGEDAATESTEPGGDNDR